MRLEHRNLGSSFEIKRCEVQNSIFKSSALSATAAHLQLSTIMRIWTILKAAAVLAIMMIPTVSAGLIAFGLCQAGTFISHLVCYPYSII